MLSKFNEIQGAGSAVRAMLDYVELGGPLIMWPLLAIAVVLWFALGYRFSLLSRGSRKNVRVLLRRYEEGRANPPNGVVDEAIARGVALRRAGQPDLRDYLDEAFGPLEHDLKRFAILIGTLVAVAPLLGLLGTVTGMIETFESLGDMTLFSQTGGIASGIATALFTTQMGLVVAVPGVIAKGILDKRQFQLEMDLAQIKDILCSSPKGSPA
jgi:biopolymer transport protein ExbB